MAAELTKDVPVQTLDSRNVFLQTQLSGDFAATLGSCLQFYHAQRNSFHVC